MNKPLPRVSCNHCSMVQDYRGQANCLHCEKRLNNWSVASQLKTRRIDYKYHYDDVVKKEGDK